MLLKEMLLQIDSALLETDRIRIVVTSRLGGVSEGPYKSANLAYHVNDDPIRVENNRRQLVSTIGLDPVWLEQVHGSEVIAVTDHPDTPPVADAMMTANKGLPLAIMTADCVPIMLWQPNGEQIAAIHAGWRGLANGIIENVVKRLCEGEVADLHAYIGPAIGACHYEVDDVVRRQFVVGDAFSSSREGHYRFDLAAETRRQLSALGVNKIIDSGICTACDDRYYSYRQTGETGRFATLIWRC